MEFSDLTNNLGKDYSTLRQLKLAVLGDSSTQLLVKALRGYGYERGYDLKILEGDFDQIDLLIRDRGSSLYEFSPDAVLLLTSSEALQNQYYTASDSERAVFVDSKIEEVRHFVELLIDNAPGRKVIISNFPELNDGVYGNNANKSRHSLLYVVRKLNLELMDLAAACSSCFILDVSLLQNRFGRNQTFDARLCVTASMVHAIEALPYLAKGVVDIIACAEGKGRKCLVLDLDNTIWGGVIGDDGIERIEIGDLGIGEAFSRIQRWARELRRRGILLAVCSKNTEQIAKEPFEKHGEMVLRLEDISVFVANWNSKVENIKYIQSVLNIGFDSMVFVDDNPFERGIVRAGIPEIAVVDLPEDPAEYVEYLQELNLFEAGTLSALDADRTRLIQLEIQRKNLQSTFDNEEDFLSSLNMICRVSSFNAFNGPRVSQLSQRSNQFNLRTVRYTEQDVTLLADSEQHVGLAFSLEDNLGDHGLICVIVLRREESRLFIENWFMSCRVLKRGMEHFALNQIAALARDMKYETIVGEYIPTKKNELVKDHYRNLGFSDVGEGHWALAIADFVELKHCIGNGDCNV